MLTDAQNASGGRYDGVAGDRIRVVGVGDRTHSLRVTGVGRKIARSGGARKKSRGGHGAEDSLTA